MNAFFKSLASCAAARIRATAVSVDTQIGSARYNLLSPTPNSDSWWNTIGHAQAFWLIQPVSRPS